MKRQKRTFIMVIVCGSDDAPWNVNPELKIGMGVFAFSADDTLRWRAAPVEMSHACEAAVGKIMRLNRSIASQDLVQHLSKDIAVPNFACRASLAKYTCMKSIQTPTKGQDFIL